MVTVLSGSVALLGDTLHNAADALAALPLGVAFILGRRPPTRRYTYGYGRAEDLAWIAIVVIIAASSALAAHATITRLMHPHHVSGLAVVAAAALIGFAGNELAAGYRIRTGQKICSAALVADGLHATSALTADVPGRATRCWRCRAGLGLGRPGRGLLITVPTLAALWQAAREIYRRLLDAVDPALVDQAESTLRATSGSWTSSRSGCAGSAIRSAPGPGHQRHVPRRFPRTTTPGPCRSHIGHITARRIIGWRLLAAGLLLTAAAAPCHGPAHVSGHDRTSTNATGTRQRHPRSAKSATGAAEFGPGITVT